jgi:hypothetical protein
MKKAILQGTEEQQLRWDGNIMRLGDRRNATTWVTEWNSQGQGRRGREVSTWKDGINDNKHSKKLKGQE